MSKTLYIIVALIIIFSFLLGLNANIRLQKIESQKQTSFTEDQIKKLAQEETVKIINQLIANQQAQQTPVEPK
jgi:hypothetical protein